MADDLDADAGRRAFVRAHTKVVTPPLLPELPLHLATEITPLWNASEKYLEHHGVAPPYWAFAWAGGQGLARTLLDRPELVARRRVLDIASGSGLVGLAAWRAGASLIRSVDVDPMATVAATLNALLQPPHVGSYRAESSDVTSAQPADFDVIVAGDVFYEASMASVLLPWLRAAARAGATVLFGDPGRAYLPTDGRESLACLVVPTIDDVEGQREREVTVYRLLGAP